jgi:DNA uptake protein ComE-like DNA-binding protein
LLLLLALVAILQFGLFFQDFTVKPDDEMAKQQWLSVQSQFDSLAKQKPKGYEIRPFNPNFISDFKGYQLGMSVAEIDRLLAFRKTDRYVNSAAEFQQVTQISDSLLAKMAPLFKFPDWVKAKRTSYQRKAFEKSSIVVLDINLATQQDLKKLYGIGDGLSERILKEKEKLGGFVSMEQMNDIWGLSPEVIEKLNQSFEVKNVPVVKKIKVNEMSVKELGQFPYFRYPLAKSIVTYRSMNGPIKDVADLAKVYNFPIEKMEIIALYLEF